MEHTWTADEDDLLWLSIHSSSCGGICRVKRTWAEIADDMNAEVSRRGINTRVYNRTNVAQRYAQMPKAQLEQAIKDAATKTAGADRADNTIAETHIPLQEVLDGRKLPSLLASPTVLERTAQPMGPPKQFEKYEDRKDQRSEKKRRGLT